MAKNILYGLKNSTVIILFQGKNNISTGLSMGMIQSPPPPAKRQNDFQKNSIRANISFALCTRAGKKTAMNKWSFRRGRGRGIYMFSISRSDELHPKHSFQDVGYRSSLPFKVKKSSFLIVSEISYEIAVSPPASWNRIFPLERGGGGLSWLSGYSAGLSLYPDEFLIQNSFSCLRSIFVSGQECFRGKIKL